MKISTLFGVVGGLLGAGSALAEQPDYKVHIDPTMAAAGYANVQLDRQISSMVSAGLMFWHLDDASWGSFDNQDETSIGVRLDWFEEGVFASGWHSNAMVKVDLQSARYARTRLKLTQTYQVLWRDIYANFGIGVQFLVESEQMSDSRYDGFQSWMLPAWEIAIGRAF
ncbi:hypothetical protein [Reinekea sp. G2M2-21]|uniref:hypothetical protein n=1 Tax=Reinekea sp. G2M2-21 TaxID=2788942 RepID=UPI0018AA4552|nr:hypothetical protein [Reinekea sp. G2M2-21]